MQVRRHTVPRVDRFPHSNSATDARPVLRLSVIGSFDLSWHGTTVPLPPSVERLVAYVALHEGHSTRPRVAGTLWSAVPEERAMANLRSALWRLGRQGLPVLCSVGDRLSLAPEVTVDLREVSRAAHHVIDHGRMADDAGIDVLASYDDLLGEWYDDWVLIEREHFRLLRLSALERMAHCLAGDGRFGRAVEIALAAVAAEPLRETAHRALIEIHLAEGNRPEALRQFDVYRRLMRDELDLEPSLEMAALVAPLRSTSRV